MEGDSHRYLAESSKICFTSWTRFLLKFLHGVLVIDIGTNFISTHPCILTEYSIFPGRVYTTAVCYFFLFNKFHIYATNIPVWLSKGLSTLDQIFVSLQIISQQIKVLFNILFLCFLLFPPLFKSPSHIPPLWLEVEPVLQVCGSVAGEAMPFSAETLHLPFCWLRGDFCVPGLQVLKFSIKQLYISLHSNILKRVLEIGY